MELQGTQPHKQLQTACDAKGRAEVLRHLALKRPETKPAAREALTGHVLTAMRGGDEEAGARKGPNVCRPRQPPKGENEAVHAPRKTMVHNGGLRERYALVMQMRSNETQEALAREGDLSRIIIDLQKSMADMKASRELEREVHARESFYLLKENESLKNQVRVAEKLLADARSMHDLELSGLRKKVSDMEDLLAGEQEHSKTREAEQERVIQQLCNSLYTTQKELERYMGDRPRVGFCEAIRGGTEGREPEVPAGVRCVAGDT
ncbi:uncharacterized protein Tco025E_04113 [Trypanosoma conorhini]|uniref:Uncharacterized protein n=1 Tax=Trypanosoma conorhini TaxID=83891 RepID=A0A3R7PH18_9TRYP|nr:uncharacterized protein Tco025E_04113 [Trypanosoma conorhini]RNF19776.1 hypothetical protein Tco025E_04113 [Trypanosoma conorhini]